MVCDIFEKATPSIKGTLCLSHKISSKLQWASLLCQQLFCKSAVGVIFYDWWMSHFERKLFVLYGTVLSWHYSNWALSAWVLWLCDLNVTHCCSVELLAPQPWMWFFRWHPGESCGKESLLSPYHVPNQVFAIVSVGLNKAVRFDALFSFGFVCHFNILILLTS